MLSILLQCKREKCKLDGVTPKKCYGETVDSNGAMTSELLFDRNEIQTARTLFERHSIHTISEFIEKNASNKFKNPLHEHDILL